MATQAWDDGMGTGVDSMDAEHRLQVSLVNALEELVRQRVEKPLVATTLERLVDFTNVHFLSEELMMRLYAYPQHDAHKFEHGRLLDQLQEARARLEAGDEAQALAAIAGLRKWLVEHIQSMDQAFAAWCAESGIRAC
jgi:hemerythrin